MAKLGNLWFDLGLDTRQLDKAWGEAMKKYQAQGKFDTKLGSKKTLDGINAQNSALGTQHRLMQNLHTLAASYVSIFAAGRLVRELITVSGEFEMQRVSLQAILKDLDGANKIFDQIKELAVKSPFQFKDLISYTKQLSAFSIPMGELYDTTKMLSDVSAGLGVGMDRLVLAYGQIRAASVLRGQEVRQLTEAGIPVIEELRKKFEALGETGITAADVFDKISARLVPFSMIKDMFEDMTSAGGKFYKMQEIQAETLKGKVSNLKDAYQIMFSEIGEKGDGILKGGVDTLRLLISNYEDVGKTILELTLTYGAYKAVVLSLTAVEKARYSATLMMGAAEKTITTWQGLRVAMTNALTAAQERLNIAMAKNPYLLAGVAVAALGYGIYKLISYQTDLEKSLERLEESYAKTSAETGVQVKELDRLYARLQLAKEGSAEYLKARNDIERTFGDTLSGLKNEKGGVLDLADAYEVLKTKIIETAQERGYEKAMEGAKEDLAKGIEKQLKGLYDALDRTTKLSSYEKERLKEALTPVLWGTKDFESLDTETKRLFNSLTEAKAKFGGGAYDKNPLQTYLDTSNRLQDSFDKTEQTAQKMFKTIGGETGGEMWPPKPEWLNASDWEQELTKYALTLNKFGELVTRKGDESIEDFLSRLREDYANTSDLISSRSKLAGEDVSGLKERLMVLSGAFKVLGVSPLDDRQLSELDKEKQKQEEERQKLEGYRADLIELEKKLALDLAKARIDGMAEGFDKEMAQMDYEHQRRIEQIEKQKRDLLEMQKKAGGSGEQLTPENAAVIGGLVGAENTRYNTARNNFYKTELEEYSNFEQKKRDIDEKYKQESLKIAVITAGKGIDVYTSAISVMVKNYKKELTDLEESTLKDYGLDWLYGDTSEFMTKKIKSALPLFHSLAESTAKELKKVKTIVSEITIPPETLAELEKAGFDIKELLSLLEKIKKETNEEVDSKLFDNISKMANAISNSVSSLGSSLSELGGVAGEIGSALSGLAGSIDGIMTAFSKTATKEEKISGGIAAIANLGKMVINQIAENKRAQEDWTSAIADSEHEMQMLKLATFDYQQGNIFGIENPYARAISGAKQYVEAMKEVEATIAKLNEGKVQTGTKKAVSVGNVAKGVGYGAGAGAAIGSIVPVIGTAVGAAVGAAIGGIVGLFSTKTVPVFENLKKKYGEIYNKDTFELNPQILADYAKLDEATKKIVDNWEDIKDKAKEAQDEMRQNFIDLAGDVGDKLSDALVNAYKDGRLYSAIDDFESYMSDTIGNIIQQLIFSAIFGKDLKELEKRFDESFLGENADYDITDDLEWFLGVYEKGISAYGEAMDDAVKKFSDKGIDILSPTQNEQADSLGKGIQSLTETTGNLVASYLNSVRSDTSIIRDTVKSNAPVLGNINEQMGVSLAHLSAISTNTLRSAVGVERVVAKLDALTSQGGATKLNVRATV